METYGLTKETGFNEDEHWQQQFQSGPGCLRPLTTAPKSRSDTATEVATLGPAEKYQNGRTPYTVHQPDDTTTDFFLGPVLH